jgi:hypothetical protein
MQLFGSWDGSRTYVFRAAWCMGRVSTNQGHGATSALPEALVFPCSQHPGSQMALSGIPGERKHIRGQQVQRCIINKEKTPPYKSLMIFSQRALENSFMVGKALSTWVYTCLMGSPASEPRAASFLHHRLISSIT